jgi:hypothetical protein
VVYENARKHYEGCHAKEEIRAFERDRQMEVWLVDDTHES